MMREAHVQTDAKAVSLASKKPPLLHVLPFLAIHHSHHSSFTTDCISWEVTEIHNSPLSCLLPRLKFNNGKYIRAKCLLEL